MKVFDEFQTVIFDTNEISYDFLEQFILFVE
jgi:hypothetical protein